MLRLKDPGNLIVVLAALQVLSSTFLLDISGFYGVNSLIFLFSGIGIAICLLFAPPLKIQKSELLNRQLLLKLFVVACMLPISYQYARHIMDNTLLQYQDADMLPIMKVMGQRFWSGEWRHVYDPIPEIWNGIKPIYLPGMWLPFSLSVVFHFDIRWITVCGIWMAVLLCVLPSWRISWQAILFAITLLCLLTWLHTDKDNSVIELTEEGVVFCYYALLTTAIVSGNPWLMGISLALCLLSRYSLVGWIPFAVVFLLMTKKYSFLAKSFASALAVVIVLLILPFGVNPLMEHLTLHRAYIAQAGKVWQQNPEFYYADLGMAKFFGPSHVKLLHGVLETGSFLVPLGLLFAIRKTMYTRSNILLAGLQLSLTFFYNFLDVTYLYLYYTPVVVTLVIAGWSLNVRTNARASQ